MAFEYQRLLVYQRATAYNAAAAPLIAKVKRRDPALGKQLEKNGSSMAGNMAEGAADDRPRVKANFYRIAKRETEEAAGHWETAARNGFVTQAEIEPLHTMLDEIARMLFGLIRRFDPALRPISKPAGEAPPRTPEAAPDG